LLWIKCFLFKRVGMAFYQKLKLKKKIRQL